MAAAQEIDRLVVVWDANYQKLDDKLNKVIRANYGAAAKVEKAWDKKFGTGAAKGLEDLARQAGRASGPVQSFTQQLGLAGASSLALAAALGAATFAVQRAIEAMEFGDDLQAQADKIGITSERLQQLQFVADETDIPVEKLAASLEKLNGVVGAIKTGVGDTRIKEAVAALGLTPADVANVRTGVDLLPLLADRLGRVGTVAEQVQIAKKMGVEDLLPALRLGSDGLAELEDRARKLGLVLDNETVRQLADANREMELAGQQIKTSLRAGFSGLATDIAAATTGLAQFLLWMRQVEERAPIVMTLLRSAAAGLVPGSGLLFRPRPGNQVGDVSAAGIDTFLRLNSKPAGNFNPQFDKPRGGGADTSAADARARQDRTRRIADEIYRAQLAELDIHNNSNRSLEDQLGFGLDRLNLEREHRRQQLDQLEEEYRTSKAKQGISAAERAKLEQAEEMVRAGEERNLRDRVANGLREEQERHLDALADADLELLQLATDAAFTAEGRVQLERALLLETRRLGRERLERELALNRNLDDAARAAELAAFDRVTTGAVRGFDANVTNRMREQFRDAFHEGVRAAADGGLGGVMDMLADRFKTRLIDNLADGVFDLLSGAKGGGGGVVGSVLSLFGFRSGGGSVMAGRPYVVGERGRELMVPGASGTVISADVLRAIGAQRAAPAVTVVQALHFHAEGAVLTGEILEQANRMSQQHAVSAFAASGQAIPANMQRRARRRLG